MGRDAVLLRRPRPYLAKHSRVTLSVTTQYALLRDLQAREAYRQIEAFRNLCEHCRLLESTPVVGG